LESVKNKATKGGEPRTVDFFTGRRCERVAVAVVVARSSPEPHRNGGGTYCAIVLAVTMEHAFPRRFRNVIVMRSWEPLALLSRPGPPFHCIGRRPWRKQLIERRGTRVNSEEPALNDEFAFWPEERLNLGGKEVNVG